MVGKPTFPMVLWLVEFFLPDCFERKYFDVQVEDTSGCIGQGLEVIFFCIFFCMAEYLRKFSLAQFSFMSFCLHV